MLQLRNKKIYFAAVLSVLFGLFNSHKVLAISATDDQLHETAIMIGVETCYRDYVKSEVKKSDFDTYGWSQIFDTSKSVGGKSWGSDGKIIVPTYVGNTISDNDLSCSETFSGYDGWGGKAKGFTNYASIPNNLEDLGLVYDHTDTGGSNSSQVTIKLDSVSDASGNNTHGATVSGSIVVSGEKSKSGNHWKWTVTSVTGTITAKYVYGDIDDTVYTIVYNNNYQHIGVQSTPFDGSYAANFAWNDDALGYAIRGDLTGSNEGATEDYSLADMLNENYIPELKTNIESAFYWDPNAYTEPVASISITDTTPTSSDSDNAEAIYVPVSFGSAPGQNMKYNANAGADIPYLTLNFSGRTGWSHYYPRNYIYALYYKYLSIVQDEYPSISIDSNCPTTKPTSGHYFKNSESTWCQVTIPNDASASLYKSLAIVNSGNLEMGTFADILTWFENEDSYSGLAPEDYANLDPENPTITTTTTTGGDENEAEGDPEEVACYQNAGSLGWIMCPMIFGLRGIGEKFYAVAEPFLQTNESIVAELGSQTSGLYQAWLVFRNIANIIFVIIFMFIIFSQLTGWGIDNYGIKKMLPKLILVAILVNLSYIICAIAVDASNIVGQGVRGLFENVAKSVSDTGGLGDSATEAIGVIVKKVVAIIATGGVGLAGVAIAAEISGSGWFLIVPVLLFLLTLLASAFFAIIMLGLRQALIVILIVIAPIAFALSVLPNTETIYKKWFSIAKGVLMVYPIVGAVIGAGYLTARILMNTDQGFIMTIVAGLLMSVPYFMIPSITRKALDAVGGIGTKLTGIGRTGVSKANHGIKGSDLYNDAKSGDKARRAQNWMNSKRAQKIQDDINSGKKVSMRRANKYSRMAGLANSREQANINARSAQSQFNRLQGDGYTAAMSAAQRSEEDMAVKNFETLIENGDYKYGGNTDGVNFQDNEAIGKALEHELANGGDVNKIRALQNILNRKGDKGRDAIFKAMSNAQKTENGVSAAAVRAFSSNIMNNQSDYKSSHRSLYEFAKSTAVSGSGNINDYKTAGIAALTQSSFLGTDATQMNEYLKAYRSGTLSDEDKIHLEELAHGIANNPNVHGSIRKDDYGEALATFAPDVDWSKVYNSETGLKVEHGSQTQSTPSPSAPSASTQAAQAGAQQTAANQNVQTIVNNTHQNAANNSSNNNNNGGGDYHQTDSGIWVPN